MKIVDRIDGHIDFINRIAQAKRTLDHLKVIWETDIKKIKLDKLFGGNPVKDYKYIRLDKIKIEPNPDKEALFSSSMDSERMINLIELMDSETKTIPPIYIDEYVIKDGIEEVEKSTQFVDGAHRQRIASYLQLSEIPVMVFKKTVRYIFTPGNWKFELKQNRESHEGGYSFTGSYLEAVSIDGKVVNITTNNHPLYLASDYLEYIVIEAP